MYPYKLVTPNIQGLSLVVVQLEFFCGAVSLATSTGFTEQFNNKVFLITNWHCVTGRDPFTGKETSEDGITPDSVSIHLHSWDGASVHVFNPTYRRVEINYRKGSKWLMHKSGQSIDIVACDITDLDFDGGFKAFLSNMVNHRDAVVQVGAEVFILGFPTGLTPTGSLPIWKRGSIATEPSAPAGEEPCFWIDAATRVCREVPCSCAFRKVRL
jgi:hypothetical protein